MKGGKRRKVAFSEKKEALEERRARREKRQKKHEVQRKGRLTEDQRRNEAEAEELVGRVRAQVLRDEGLAKEEWSGFGDE